MGLQVTPFGAWCLFYQGFSGGSVGKESICIAGDTGDVGLIPGSGISPGGGNPLDREDWWAVVHGVAKNWTWLKRLSTHTGTHVFFIILSPSVEPRWIHSESSLIASISAAAAAKSLQSCPTLCDPIDGSPPGSPVPGILQASISRAVLNTW